MKHCKRLTVRAMGVNAKGLVYSAINGNFTEEGCTEIPGQCGCVHAEINLLEKLPDATNVYVSHSPCINCAKALVEAKVKKVVYAEEYRLRDGIDYLVANGVEVESIGEEA